MTVRGKIGSNTAGGSSNNLLQSAVGRGTAAIPLLIVLAGSLFGQFSQTINQTVYSGLTVIPGSSVILSNIGQSAHQIQAQLRNAPTHICSTSTTLLVGLEYTIDGSNWTTLVQIIGDPGNNQLKYIRYGTGAFPGLRATVYGFDNTNCVLDVFYAGSLYPVGYIPPESDGFLFGRASVTVGVGVTTAVAGPAITHNAALGQHLSLYAINVVNNSSGSEIVSISASSVGSACAGGLLSPQQISVTLPPGNATPAQFLLSAAKTPYVTMGPVLFGAPVPAPEQVCVTLGANASTHNVVVQVTYRIEP